jgi:hypothetical protein
MPMSRLAMNPHVTQLSGRLRPLGYYVHPAKLEKVLEFMGWDVDLAQTAFVMSPQPSWLTELVGPREAQER